MLTQERLKELLRYDPETGVFTNRVYRGSRATIGVEAGHLNNDGYRRVCIGRKLHPVHRLAWLYYYGAWPEYDIDHIDRNRSNNRICNLRQVTKQCNARNSKKNCRNTSGVTGVFWEEDVQKWRVRITISQKRKTVGYSSDFTEAVAYRLAAEQCLDWMGCNSNSPAYKYMQKYLNERRRQP